jgi:16S rRNA (cytidine1402-2'-O)-methyltransferase
MAALYVIPAPIGGAARDALPAAAIDTVRALRDFVAESPRSARAVLAGLGMPCAIRELSITRLDEHTPARDVPALLAPLRAGRSLGLLSDAGCPGIADPGAALVEQAHRAGCRVVPLVGPSAILLALMASGLGGQHFAFCGYLPRDRERRARRIRELERHSRAEGQTQIFIETPYRNRVLQASLLENCSPGTRLCVACDLTAPGELIVSRTVADWRRQPLELPESPAVFLLQA